jgi:Tfp pilus assembly protein PilF
MGRVYRAVDLNLERPVAIKLLSERTLGDRSFLDRFKREARLAAQLNHPNIATIYAFGEEEGEAFIAMEFVEGETLSSILERGALPIPTARRYARQVASALAVAHAKGIVHRDIKPANLMVNRDGVLKVMDFGVARRSGETQLTMAGSIIGTANIMAPEIVRGGEVTPAADLFSLGCVLYEMLAGRPAFDGQDAMAVLYLVMNEEARPILEIRADVPADLAAVTAGLMEKDPSRRLGPAARVAELLADDRGGSAGGTLVADGAEVGTMILPSPGEGTGAGDIRAGGAVVPDAGARGNRRRWMLALPVGALLLLAAWFVFLRPQPPDPAGASQANLRGISILQELRPDSTQSPAVRDSLLRVARGEFERAISLDRKSPTAWNNLGDVYRRLGDLDAAQERFDRAVSLDPRYIAAWLNRADVLERRGIHEGAVSAYRRTLALNDSTFRAIAASPDPAAAGSAALKRDPTLVLAPNNLAHLLVVLDRPDSAAAVLAPVVRVFPRIPALWKNYGLARLGTGNAAAADTAFDRAMESGPSGYGAVLAAEADSAAGRGQDALARGLWRYLASVPDTALAARAAAELRRVGS